MPAKELLQEVQHLKGVSRRLELLAADHLVVESALLTISGTILHTATVLEILVATKFTPGTATD